MPPADPVIQVDRVTTRAFLRALGDTPGETTTARVLACLLLRPQLAEHKDLIEFCFGDDPDGGPDWPIPSIGMSIWRLRRRGWLIRTAGHRGYWLPK